MKSLSICMFLGLIVLGGLATAQEVGSIVEHVPADACLALASGDIGQTCNEFRQSRIGELFTGPVFRPLIEELRRRHLGGPLNLRPVVGFDWQDLEELHSPGGLFLFPLPEDQLGLGWIFDGAPSTGDESPLAAAAKYFGEQGFSGENVTRAGASWTVLTPPASKENKRPRVLFAARGFYGVANSPAAAEAILAVAPGKSLADDPLWKSAPEASATSQQPGDVRLSVRPMPLWDLVRKARPGPTEDAQQSSDEPQRDPFEAAQHLGLDGVQAIVGRLTFPTAGKRDWELSIRLVTPRPYSKALRLLELQPGPMPQLPAYIAADATSATFWRWDFGTAMKGFGNLFDEANEPGLDGVGLFEDMLDGLRDDPEGVQVDLRREVFDQLGPEIVNITDRLGPKSETLPNGDRTLYVAQVRNVPLVANALKRFYDGDERVKHEQQEGYDIWTVPEGASLFVEGESDSVVSVRALALGESRMLFGTDEELLRTTLAGGSASGRMQDDPVWSELWQGMQQREGDAASLWALARLDEILAPSYAEATTERTKPQEESEARQQQAGALGGLWRVLLFGTADPDREVPLAAAPVFDLLRPGLPPSSVTFVPSQEGWTVTIGGLRRNQ